jgi:ubiquinone/menaquinone biosynthesis C-methylase UbiE
VEVCIKEISKLNNENSKYYFEEHPYDIIESLISEKTMPVIKHIHISKVDAIYKLLNPKKDFMVLDLGCGTGYASLMHEGFANNDLKVVSVDISKSGVSMGKKYSIKFGINRDFMVGDGTKLPFKNNSFDCVFCINLLHHIKNHQHTLNEMARVGKSVCCVEPNSMNPVQRRYQKTEIAKKAGDTKSFFLKELKKDFESSGLKNIKSRGIHYIYPTFKGKLFEFNVKLEPIIEKIPIINLISGSIVIYGEK